MKLLIKKNPDIRLLLVGGGPENERLRNQVVDLGLDNHVVFTGRIPHAEVSRYYDLVDFFVYPRLSMRLTDLVTPLKPLEAMANGRPVIASNVGGHKELIIDGETGRLFATDDLDDLVRVISDMVVSSNQVEHISHAGRKFVEKERNWPISVARYESVYQKVLR